MNTKNITYLLLFTMSSTLFGCQSTGAPKGFPPAPEPLTFEETPNYEPDLSKLKAPEQPVMSYGKMSADKTSVTIVATQEEADYVMFTPQEFAKVGQVVSLARTYKELTGQQAELINTYIDNINALKGLAAVEREKAIAYRQLWLDALTMYNQERKERLYV
jgi:hypothetical protein